MYNVHTLDKLEIDPCERENEGVLVLPQRECGGYLAVRLRQLAPGVGGGGGKLYLFKVRVKLWGTDFIKILISTLQQF